MVHHLALTKTNYAHLVFSRNTCVVCMNHRAGHAVFHCYNGGRVVTHVTTLKDKIVNKSLENVAE